VVVCSGAANGSQSSCVSLSGSEDGSDSCGSIAVVWDVEEADDPDSGAGKTSDSYSPLANSDPGEAGKSP
jgi:hypothetical protein